jgi:hypothetical protein
VSRGEKSHPFFQDIPGCIYIPIMVRSALWASPFSQVQILDRFVPVPTIRAELTGGEGLVHFRDDVSVPPGFILGDELRPGSIGNGFGKTMIFYHVLHLQILQTDHLVLANQPGGEFVKKIMASILNLLMDPSDFQASFLPTITPVLATRENPLPSSQLLLVLPEKFWSLFFFSVRVDEKNA